MSLNFYRPRVYIIEEPNALLNEPCQIFGIDYHVNGMVISRLQSFDDLYMSNHNKLHKNIKEWSSAGLLPTLMAKREGSNLHEFQAGLLEVDRERIEVYYYDYNISSLLYVVRYADFELMDAWFSKVVGSLDDRERVDLIPDFRINDSAWWLNPNLEKMKSMYGDRIDQSRPGFIWQRSDLTLLYLEGSKSGVYAFNACPLAQMMVEIFDHDIIKVRPYGLLQELPKLEGLFGLSGEGVPRIEFEKWNGGPLVEEGVVIRSFVWKLVTTRLSEILSNLFTANSFSIAGASGAGVSNRCPGIASAYDREEEIIIGDVVLMMRIRNEPIPNSQNSLIGIWLESVGSNAIDLSGVGVRVNDEVIKMHHVLNMVSANFIVPEGFENNFCVEVYCN